MLSIRPKLELPQAQDQSALAIQNEVLRPILKLQDELTRYILESSSYYKRNMHPSKSLPEEDYRLLIKDLLSNDKILRNQIIGMITGMMTLAELTLYSNTKSAMNKRLIQMQIERYVSHYY